jgi:prepilin-type N-terminal cleavage/methylation domain-containing protein
MSERGVTLVELLIAVTLVSLLSVAGLIALRVGIGAMEKSDERLMFNRRAMGAQRALEGQISGFMPVVADCAGATSGGGPVTVPFFEGEPTTMRFVSSYSLEESYRGLARILEYNVIGGENGQGVRLVVNETLYTGARSAGSFCLGIALDLTGVAHPRWSPSRAGPGSFVLADKLAFCRFFYLERLDKAPYERWVPRWASERWPLAVRLEMQPMEPSNTRVMPVTVTAPLHAQRIPGVHYGF